MSEAINKLNSALRGEVSAIKAIFETLLIMSIEAGIKKCISRTRYNIPVML